MGWGEEEGEEGGGGTPAPDRPVWAGIQQSQFRGGKSVSKLPADLYFLRAFWLMKT